MTAGSHFCANCGRPVTATPPVVSCANCGAALSAEAKFCVACGHGVEQREEPLEALPAPSDQPDGG